MKNRVITTIFFLLCALCGAHGQTIAEFKEKLAVADSLSGARVECVELGGAAEAVAKFDAQTAPVATLQGYRIRIYSGNHQLARSEAEAAKALFEENYTVPAYFTYENPYFLVTCGNCLSQEEAMMLLRSVRFHFPKAFVVMAEIPMEAIVARPTPKPAEQEESAEQPTATTEPTAPTQEVQEPQDA